MNICIPGIDTEKAIKTCGSVETFTELLIDVYNLIEEKSALAESYLKEQDCRNFSILVHSLKTTCRTIGAMDLGEQFFTLEKLGKENQVEQLQTITPEVLANFRSLKSFLEPFVKKNSDSKKAFDKEEMLSLFHRLLSAMEDFDLTVAEDVTNQLLCYDCNDPLSHQLNTLHKLVSNLDYEEAKSLCHQVMESL